LQDAELAGDVALPGDLGFVHLRDVVPLTERLVDLTRTINGEGAGGLQLDGAAKVFDAFLGLLQAFVPQATELFVHRRQLGADLGVLRRERRERLGAPLEQGHKRFDVALVAIELCETVGGGALCGVAFDRLHQHACRAVGVAERRRPDVRGFA
jgi:hypothetical protein